MNHCVVCDKEKSVGYYLYHSFICTDCEKKIIETDSSDPAYQVYVEKLRAVREERIIS